MNKAIKNIEDNKKLLRNINTESPSAALTARTAGTVALAAAGVGTILSWTDVIRSQAITVSGTNIFIPTNGYYAVEMPCQVSAANLWMRCLINVNTIFVQGQQLSSPAGSDQTVYTFNFMRYFLQGDLMRIYLDPQVNCNLLRTAESANAESGIINIVQLSGAIE